MAGGCNKLRRPGWMAPPIALRSGAACGLFLSTHACMHAYELGARSEESHRRRASACRARWRRRPPRPRRRATAPSPTSRTSTTSSRVRAPPPTASRVPLGPAASRRSHLCVLCARALAGVTEDTNLPADLKRNLTTLRDLDSTSQELFDRMQKQCDKHIKLAKKAVQAGREPEEESLHKARRIFRELMEVDEEKVELADQARALALCPPNPR